MFANPYLLFGSALIAVPIVLHLIMRRKPTILEFPALRFIQKRHDTNQRRLRLRHLLLLLLRMAAIALLAFALAQPRVKFGGGMLGSQESPVTAALVFDAAPHMEYRHENKTRLEVARQWGLSLLAEFPPESQIAVLDTHSSGGGFAAVRGMAKRRIELLEPVTNSQPLIQAVKEAVDLVGKATLPGGKEVYVFSDLSRAAWPSDAAAALQDSLVKTPGVSVCLIDVGVKEPRDFSLGELRLSRQVLSNLGSLDIDTEISCIGPGGDRPVELQLDGVKREQKTVSLPAGQSRQLGFHLEGFGPGTHQGLLRIVGQDGLAADDARYFTVEVKRPWRVLIAAPRPAHDRALFLSQALAPVLWVQRGRAVFDCRVIGSDQLPRVAGRLCGRVPVGSDAAGTGALAEIGRLRRRGPRRGGLPGPQCPARRFLQRPRRATPVAGQTVAAGAAARRRQLPRPEVAGTSHPGRFPSPCATETPWDDASVFRYWELAPPAAGVDVVLPYVDGRPACWNVPWAMAAC